MNVLDIDLDFFLDRSVGVRADYPANPPDEYGLQLCDQFAVDKVK